MLAMSSRSYLCYEQIGKYRVVPLSYDPLNHVSAFTSERCPEGGMVALADNQLRIIKVDRLSDQFTFQEINTRYTPVKMQVHQESGNLIVLEKDHQSFSFDKLEDIR